MNYKFNETLLTIPPSASLAVSEKAKRLKAEGIDVIITRIWYCGRGYGGG